jgi:hypothetical protein
MNMRAFDPAPQGASAVVSQFRDIEVDIGRTAVPSVLQSFKVRVQHLVADLHEEVGRLRGELLGVRSSVDRSNEALQRVTDAMADFESLIEHGQALLLKIDAHVEQSQALRDCANDFDGKAPSLANLHPTIQSAVLPFLWRPRLVPARQSYAEGVPPEAA